MTRRRLLLLVALVCTALNAGVGLAQGYRVDTYSVEDGLPSAELYDLAQDSDGRLWMVARAGLTVWDGVAWRLFVPPEVPASQPGALASDPSGRVWSLFLSTPWSVGWWDGNDWNYVPQQEELRGLGGPLGFAVAESGDGEPVVAVATPDGLWLGRDDGWSRLSEAEDVLDVVTWGGQFLVITPQEITLVDVDSGVVRSWNEQMPDGSWELLAVTVGDEGDAWLLSDRWLGRLRPDRFELLVRLAPLGDASIAGSDILMAVEPGSRAVYVASLHLLFRIELASGELEHLGAINGLQNDGATALLVGREGLVWVAGLRGLSKIVSLQFATYRRTHGLLEDEVTAVCEIGGGQLVLGHNRGLTVVTASPVPAEEPYGSGWKLRSPKQYPFPDDVTSWQGVRVLDLWASHDQQDTVWVAASAQGLARWRPTSGFEWAPFGQQIQRPTSVVGTDDGSVWIASYQGLFRAQGDGVAAELVWEPEKDLRRVQRARDGGLWVATIRDGLYHWADGAATWIPGPEDDGAMRIYSVVETAAGDTFVGSRSGLLRLAGDHLVVSEAPTVSRPVYCLIEGPNQGLWIGTDNGYARWLDGQLRWYGPEDGLDGREANRAAVLVDSGGQLWLGTDRGLSGFRDRVLPAPGAAPRVRIETLLVGERRSSPDAPLRLAPDERSVVVQFRAVSLYDEDDVTVQTRLLPVEDQWTTAAPGTRTEIRYTSLHPGTYQVSIRAQSTTGQWSEPVTTAAVRVLPPLWQRAWFLALAALGVLGIVLTVGRIWLRARYAKRLEAEVVARTTQLAASQERYRRLFHSSVLAKLVIDSSLRGERGE